MEKTKENTTYEMKESQSSLEVGKPGTRLKLYFWEAKELDDQLQKLKEVIEKNKEFIENLNTK